MALMRVAWVAAVKTAYLFIVLIMQKNTKVTVKLMILPAHNIWCLPSLSSQIWFLSRCATFQSVFSTAGILKHWAFSDSYARAMSLITLITLVRKKIYGSLIQRRKNTPKFQGNFVKTSRSLNRAANVVKSIFVVSARFSCINVILSRSSRQDPAV